MNSEKLLTDIYKGAKQLNKQPCSVCSSKIDNEQHTTQLHFHGSQWGKCLRMVGYELKNGHSDIPNGKDCLFLFTGHLYEAAIIHCLKLMGYSISARKEDDDSEVISETNIHIAGNVSIPVTTYCHPDGVIDNKILLEMKAVKDESFKKALQGEYNQTYFGQIQAYLDALNFNEAYLIIVHRNTSEIAPPIKILRDDKFIATKKSQLAKVLYNVTIANTEVPREHKSKWDFECKFCKFKEVCWNG